MAHPRDDGRRPSSSRSTADVVSCTSPSLRGSEVFEFLVTRRTRSGCDPVVSITVAPPARCYLRVWSRAGLCAFKLPVSAAHSQRWATSHTAWLLLTHSSPARRHNIPRDDSGRHGHAVGLAPSTVGGNCQLQCSLHVSAIYIVLGATKTTCWFQRLLLQASSLSCRPLRHCRTSQRQGRSNFSAEPSGRPTSAGHAAATSGPAPTNEGALCRCE